jgi:hypothetical protein
MPGDPILKSGACLGLARHKDAFMRHLNLQSLPLDPTNKTHR